jgi:hypothetical protein
MRRGGVVDGAYGVYRFRAVQTSPATLLASGLS